MRESAGHFPFGTKLIRGLFRGGVNGSWRKQCLIPKTKLWHIRVHPSQSFIRAVPYNHLRRQRLEGVSSGYWTPPAKRSSGFQPLGFESLALRALDHLNFLATGPRQSYSYIASQVAHQCRFMAPDKTGAFAFGRPTRLPILRRVRICRISTASALTR